MKPLFTDTEEWTREAQNISVKFRSFVRDFVEEHAEYKMRDLQTILHSDIDNMILERIITRRLGKN